MEKNNITKTLIFAILILVSISLAHYFKVLLYFSDRYLWHVSLGQKYFEGIGDKDIALKHANLAFGIDKERPDAHKLMAVIYSRKGLFDKAQDELGYLKRRGNYRDYYIGMGIISQEQEKFNESIKYHKKSVDICPSDALAHLLAGGSHTMLGDYTSALKYLNQSRTLIEKVPESQKDKKIKAAIHLGYWTIYEKQGKNRNAEKEFEIAKSYCHGRIPSQMLFLDDSSVKNCLEEE